MDDLYYLRKGGAYYGPDPKGYVCDFIYAGYYSEDDAKRHCAYCKEITMHKVDVDKHNAEIENRIKDLLRLKICTY